MRIKALLSKTPKTDQYCHPQVQALGLTMYISALIAEFCNLDQVSEEDESVQADLERMTKGVSLPCIKCSIRLEPPGADTQPRLYLYLYDLYRDFSDMNIPQQSPIMSLGESSLPRHSVVVH